ncbi:hypothetical protein PIB30_099052, partial [Stylosanthes scabra]|nr:hypothetical protein [Stylosanthes scabra]
MDEEQANKPQEQPSMMDLMRELKLVNRNIGRLNKNFKGLNNIWAFKMMKKTKNDHDASSLSLSSTLKLGGLVDISIAIEKSG